MALAFLALATLAQSPMLPPRASATATVKIVTGTAVRFARPADHGGFRVTKAKIRAEDGQRRPAFLVEFQ